MKREKLLYAIGKIDDEFIEEAMEPRKESVKIYYGRWIKAAVVAACVCVVIAIPILATQNDLIVTILSGMHGWHVRTENHFEQTDFSEFLRAELIAQAKEDALWEDGIEQRSIYMPVDSEIAAEKLLGIEIPDNELLPEAICDQVHLEVEENGQLVRYDSSYILQIMINRKGTIQLVDTMAAYRYKGLPAVVTYRMNTEAVTEKDGGGFGNINTKNVYFQEQYVAASGRVCEVYSATVEGGLYVCYGYTVVDNVLIEVSILSKTDEENKTAVIDLLDGFA